jgi:hypothetical protein
VSCRAGGMGLERGDWKGKGKGREGKGREWEILAAARQSRIVAIATISQITTPAYSCSHCKREIGRAHP